MSEAPSFFRSSRFFLLLPIAFLSGLATFCYLKIRDLIRSNELVNHTHAVKSTLEMSFSLLKDAETGQRGYLLTRDTIFLQPFHSTIQKIDQVMNRLDSMVKDQPEQAQSLNRYHRQVYTRLGFLKYMIKETRVHPGMVDKAKVMQGKILMDSARSQISKMERSGDVLLHGQLTLLERETRLTPTFYITLVLCVIVLLAYWYWLIIQELTLSQRLHVPWK